MENEATNIDELHVAEKSKFKFLEAMLHFKKHKIVLKHNNKNKSAIKKHNKQKYFRYHHMHSYMHNKQKIGVVIEALIRMARYSTRVRDLQKACDLTIKELQILNYNPKIISQAFRKLTNHPERGPFWRNIKQNYD